MNRIDKSLRQTMVPDKQKATQSAPVRLSSDSNDFAEYDYFYYLVSSGAIKI